jgi:hypothetical protein
MNFDEWWGKFTNEPVPDCHGLSRRQMWTESVLQEHERTAREAWAACALSIAKDFSEKLPKIIRTM